MLADIIQVFGVVLVVLAAAGYLMLMLRRSWRQGGGCGCSGSKGLPFAVKTRVQEQPGDEVKADRVPSKQIVPVDRLVDSARDVAAESGNRPADPTGQAS